MWVLSGFSQLGKEPGVRERDCHKQGKADRQGRRSLTRLCSSPSSVQDYPKAERAGPEREKARGESEAVDDVEES